MTTARRRRVEERLIRKRERGSSRSRGADDRLGGRQGGSRLSGRGKFYPGKITRDRGDAHLRHFYDDGEREIRVAKRLIRKVGGGSTASRAVEADYRVAFLPR